jgi:hypothetical protein
MAAMITTSVSTDLPVDRAAGAWRRAYEAAPVAASCSDLLTAGSPAHGTVSITTTPPH